MSKLEQERISSQKIPDLGEIVGRSVGGVAGVVGSIVALANESDHLFHQHQIDVANTQFDALDNEIAGLQQAEEAVTQAGLAHSATFRTLQQQITLDQTHESAIHRTIPRHAGGEFAESSAIGLSTLVGCLAVGTVLGHYIGKRIDRFRHHGPFSSTTAEAERATMEL